MSTKRRILEQLDRNELFQLLKQAGVAVEDRRSREPMIEALVSSRALKLEPGLLKLKRERLKEICRALDLDDSGRASAVLVERLTGTKQQTEPKRRTGGEQASEASASGSLKSALRQFALGAAGGYRGEGAQISFTTHLLQCFGWPEGRPPSASIEAQVMVAEGGQRRERKIALWWPERRVLLEVAPHDAALDLAWKETLHVALQVTPSPQYVVLTNQRDIRLYDLARDRTAPRLSTSIDDLSKYSEAFPFFTLEWVPGMTPRIVNVEKVSAEVADLVAKLYRSVRAKHPRREKDVIRFTLQCITAMFAEDIGLLPKRYFTDLLYEGAKHGDVAKRLHDMFVQMNTRALPEPRAVPYFNGGLFTDAPMLELGSEQTIALTKAAEADWTYVDPHIFGSVFQGVMDDEERHAQGAYYTAHDDIMRVLGPTIVEPWRRRIRAASTLKDLTELREELFRFRVLDPACGSGNFLYIAFREIYRLDTELLSRMREFRTASEKVTWGGGIQPSNFFGIDINPFAVELAKVTLNIAKKIAFDERREQAYALSGQGQFALDEDPSLPLANLDTNIVCADALFTEWPPADAIVGNPPMLGDRKIRGELGAEYAESLKRLSDGSLLDLSCYWFRKAHDRLGRGGRAGLVATSGIRIGKAREQALDYLVERGGTITNAVSSMEWPGDAALNVSMVNWVKGPEAGPFTLVVDEQPIPVAKIPTHLQLHVDVSSAKKLVANKSGSAMGVIFGSESFVCEPDDKFPFDEEAESHSIRPVATGTSLLTGAAPARCILLTDHANEGAAKKAAPGAFAHLRGTVLPMVRGRAADGEETHHYERWLRTWWQPREPSLRFFADIARMKRFIACSNPQARPIFAFISTAFVPTNTLQAFAFEDDYSFGILQSDFHWRWTKACGGKVTERIRYTGEVWRTFAWPQDPTDDQVASVAAHGRELRRVRTALMKENGWSLRSLYQGAEIEGAHPLKTAQQNLDASVREAYGAAGDQEAVEFLLELNGLVSEDEEKGRPVRGPGLPSHLEPRDSRWMSIDCIQPHQEHSDE